MLKILLKIKKMKKTLFAVIILVLIVAGFFGGYYFGIKNGKTGIENKTASTNNEEITATDSNGWKVYKSDSPTFQFSYPPNYKLETNASFFDPQTLTLSLINGNGDGIHNTIKISLKYNPTFADPKDQAVQSVKNCETAGDLKMGTCSGAYGNPEKWQKVVIDDNSYGYRTGIIMGDAAITDSFHAISNILGPKGTIFNFVGYIPQVKLPTYTPGMPANATDVAIANDPGVKEFENAFDGIVKSIKFSK
jgi:hypothetical protein